MSLPTRLLSACVPFQTLQDSGSRPQSGTGPRRRCESSRPRSPLAFGSSSSPTSLASCYLRHPENVTVVGRQVCRGYRYEPSPRKTLDIRRMQDFPMGPLGALMLRVLRGSPCAGLTSSFPLSRRYNPHDPAKAPRPVSKIPTRPQFTTKSPLPLHLLLDQPIGARAWTLGLPPPVRPLTTSRPG